MSTPEPISPEQPGAPGQLPDQAPAQPPIMAQLSGPQTPPGQPSFQMQPGWVMQTQPPDRPPPDLDEHLKKITPTVWVTYVLAAINVVVFVVMMAKGVSP